MDSNQKLCYCERVKIEGNKIKGNLKAVLIENSNSYTWTHSSLYLDFNTNSGKYALFSEATGEDGSGCYVGISYCPFCGRDLRVKKEDGEK